MHMYLVNTFQTSFHLLFNPYLQNFLSCIYLRLFSLTFNISLQFRSLRVCFGRFNTSSALQSFPGFHLFCLIYRIASNIFPLVPSLTPFLRFIFDFPIFLPPPRPAPPFSYILAISHSLFTDLSPSYPATLFHWFSAPLPSPALPFLLSNCGAAIEISFLYARRSIKGQKQTHFTFLVVVLFLACVCACECE